MRKFGLKKKDDDGEDSSRLALFGSRNKSKSPAPPSNNPYAQPSIPPDPYTQAKINAGVPSSRGPPPSQSRPGYQSAQSSQSSMGQYVPPQAGYGNQRQPAPLQGGYSRDNSFGPPSSGYGLNDKFGPPQGNYSGGGYGADKFGKPNPYGQEPAGGNPYASVVQNNGTSQYAGAAGGYGGLGRTNSNETSTTEAYRDELFGGARERVQQRQTGSTNGPPGYEYNPEGVPQQERSYGAYGDRQLTAEEEEEEDVEATKQDIKFLKQQDVSSTRNALRMANQAEETGRNTLARLGAQGESIHNTERNLDIAENQARVGEDKIKEIKTLNRSMFAVHVNNPFTAQSRRDKREEEILRKHHLEREQREESREASFKSEQRMQKNFQDLSDAEKRLPRAGKSSLAERAKFQFEADSEDDQMEDEIDDNLEQLSGAAGRLHLLAKATGSEIEQQNDHLTRIAGKSDRFDDHLHTQTERMKRIH